MMTDPVNRFVQNCGASGKYDSETGLYSEIPKGIFEFRVGDEIINTNNGQRDRIVALYPVLAPNGRAQIAIVEVERKRRCLTSVVRPADPSRITFGFCVQTLSQFRGNPLAASVDLRHARKQKRKSRDLRASDIQVR